MLKSCSFPWSSTRLTVSRCFVTVHLRLKTPPPSLWERQDACSVPSFLPVSQGMRPLPVEVALQEQRGGHGVAHGAPPGATHVAGQQHPLRRRGGQPLVVGQNVRSEERRVGKEGRSRWSPYP